MVKYKYVKESKSSEEIEQEIKKISIPTATHKSFTEEEYKKKLEQEEIDALYMMKYDLQRLRYHGVLTERQFQKTKVNLKNQAAKLGITFL